MYVRATFMAWNRRVEALSSVALVYMPGVPRVLSSSEVSLKTVAGALSVDVEAHPSFFEIHRGVG